MKVIYLRQVAKENVSFVVQSQRGEVAKLRLVQLRKVTLPEISDTRLQTIKRHTLVHWVLVITTMSLIINISSYVLPSNQQNTNNQQKVQGLSEVIWV